MWATAAPDCVSLHWFMQPIALIKSTLLYALLNVCSGLGKHTTRHPGLMHYWELREGSSNNRPKVKCFLASPGGSCQRLWKLTLPGANVPEGEPRRPTGPCEGRSRWFCAFGDCRRPW